MDKKFITKDTAKYTEKYTWPIVIKISSKILKLHECQEQATWVADALSGAAAQTQISFTNKQISTTNKV
ncbi:hypothetical protein KQX54_001905 [Cotesia glomerata]|uniref:Uncharacterized protein n=1 Tax=Cotesia glomerata TaxID=32391 RepID=A0AAV7IXN0_COTGL|nr:hypothetical protein KQX54_001905 [Cotesia glomerata]